MLATRALCTPVQQPRVRRACARVFAFARVRSTCARVFAFANYASQLKRLGVEPLPPPKGQSSFEISDNRAGTARVDLCVPGEKLAHADDGTDGKSCGPVSVHSVKEGKALIKAACDKLGLSQERHALYIAMAMQESSHMDAKQRDGSKDFDGRAANFGIFNLSVDLAEKTGYFNGGNWAELTFDQWQRLNANTEEAVEMAIGILEAGIEKWGLQPTLAFVRGGSTGFANPAQDDVVNYLRAICAFLSYFDEHEKLLNDDRRVDIWVRHI